ncbi:MAG: hypothetical protein ABI421_19365, partial [Polyangiaceae bacterium]
MKIAERNTLIFAAFWTLVSFGCKPSASNAVPDAGAVSRPVASAPAPTAAIASPEIDAGAPAIVTRSKIVRDIQMLTSTDW